eukprot:333043-Pelagomonas_calceolata.AAC.1
MGEGSNMSSMRLCVWPLEIWLRGTISDLNVQCSIHVTPVQYRYSQPHPGGLCGEWSRHLEAVCTIHYVVAVSLEAGHQT